MTRRALLVSLLSVAIVQPAQAKCVSHPEILATVRVQGCVAVTFGATDSKWTWAPEHSLDGVDAWPMYRRGDKLSGTLVTVTVKNSRFVWSDGHFANGARVWTNGESRSLFLRQAPADVCPAVMPADITVQTQPVCCDTSPGGWECLLPQTIALVIVTAEKAVR